MVTTACRMKIELSQWSDFISAFLSQLIVDAGFETSVDWEFNKDNDCSKFFEDIIHYHRYMSKCLPNAASAASIASH